MRFNDVLRFKPDRRDRTREAKRRDPMRCRLVLEWLEARTVLTNYTAATVAVLISDIAASNTAGGTNTIRLAPRTTFTLTAVNDQTNGPTGLPDIDSDDILTIVGNSDTIQRSESVQTPAFRLLAVDAGGSLTLENLTLQNGLAQGVGISSEGGAIYNQGTLVLRGVSVRNNVARGNAGAQGTSSSPDGGAGSAAFGGGIYSNGSLTLDGGTKLESNQAVGGSGGDAAEFTSGALSGPGDGLVGISPSGNGAAGAPGYGGGLFVAGGNLTVSSATLSGNSAAGGKGGAAAKIEIGSFFAEFRGNGGAGGNGRGGGIFMADGTATVTNFNLTVNAADGGDGGTGGSLTSRFTSNGMTIVNIAPGADGSNGDGSGGGLYVAGGSLTLANGSITGNQADGGNGRRSATGSDLSQLLSFPLGASGGKAFGGGLCLVSGSLTLNDDLLSSNGVKGGAGGDNAIGTGGAGGTAAGGGLYVGGGCAGLTNDTFVVNKAAGGNGGDAGFPDPGGAGGDALGAGICLGGGKVTLSGGVFTRNEAQGGSGGRGGNAPIGGAPFVAFAFDRAASVSAIPPLAFGLTGAGGPGGGGAGGAVQSGGGTLTMTGTILAANVAEGGDGGQGGMGGIGIADQRGGDGGAGGDGSGGGINASGGTVKLFSVNVSLNLAVGGRGGAGGGSRAISVPPLVGSSGQPGQGDGGGLFIAESDLGVFLDAFTQARVRGNLATTLDPNIDGTFGNC
jgi:hypothetical protein